MSTTSMTVPKLRIVIAKGRRMNNCRDFARSNRSMDASSVRRNVTICGIGPHGRSVHATTVIDAPILRRIQSDEIIGWDESSTAHHLSNFCGPSKTHPHAHQHKGKSSSRESEKLLIQNGLSHDTFWKKELPDGHGREGGVGDGTHFGDRWSRSSPRSGASPSGNGSFAGRVCGE